MKKILCMVDSSPRMNQHIQFVGSLAHDVEAKIFLISAQVRSKSSLVVSGYSNPEHLDEWHDYLSGIRHVVSEIEPEEISSNPYQKLNTLGNRYDLMTMLLDSLENGKMRAAGLSLDRILNEIHHPVLLVPNDITHWEVRRLIYALDFGQDSSKRLVQLGELADWFKADIKVFILQNDDLSLHEQEKRTSIINKFRETRLGKNNITFEPAAVPTKLLFDKNYKGEYGDLPILTAQPSGLFDRLFGKDELADIIRKNSNPYLVIH